MWGTVLQGRWAYFCVCEMQGHQKIGIHTSHTSLPAQLSASSPPHWNIPHPCSLMQSSYLHCTQLCATAGSKCKVTWWSFASFLGSVFHSTRLLPSFTRKKGWCKALCSMGWLEPTYFCAKWGNSHFFTRVVCKLIFTLLGFFSLKYFIVATK